MILNDLFDIQDLKYKEFHSKLMPTVSPDRIIGVRTPELREFAKEFFKSDESKLFLNTLPHEYYEENNVHAFLIEQIDDFNAVIYETEKFLPYIDNWATCDMFQPKIFRKHKNELFLLIQKWIKSTDTYTVRYGINQLMNLYLDSDFDTKHLKMVSDIHSDEYYINMMRAWYFATALAKQYYDTVFYLEQYKLDKWTHNKTIQKAVESHRIDLNTKKYLKTLRLK